MKRTHLLLAALVLLITCWNSVGFHQGDEHFQIMEFAGYKLGFIEAELLPWEFGEQMRPAFQPALAYVAHLAFSVFGEVSPHWLTFFLRLVSAGLFLLLGVKIYRRYASVLPDNLLTWFSLLILFHWCTMYNGIRFSGENWSGMFVVFGFLLYPTPDLKSEDGIFTPSKAGPAWACFAAGLLFGLSFLLRYQMAVAVVGFGAWLLFIGRESWGRLALTIFGGILALCLGTVLDFWLYGEWVFAPWNYLRINVFEGVAATYGSLPVWAYLKLIVLRGIPPLGLIYLAAIGWFAWKYRRDPLTWLFVAFFLIHSLLSRKDIRFMFPLLPLLPIAIIAGVKALQKTFFERSWAKWGLRVSVVMSALLLVSVMVRPAATEILPAKFVYENYLDPPTIYSDGKLVYDYGLLMIYFYQRPGTTLIEERPTNGCPPGAEPCLYSVHTRDAVNPPEGAKLVYSNRPEWVKTLNFGGWQDKTKWWYVYEFE
jgi:phosphatidylinositol glycan class B